MSDRLDELAARRRALVAQSRALREHLGLHSAAVHSRLGIVDRAWSVLHGLRAKPVWMGLAAAAAVVVLRPGRLVKWVSMGVATASLFRRLRGIVSSFGSRTRRSD